MRGRPGERPANYGNGLVELDLDAELDGNAQAEEIAERLSATFHSPGYTPPLLPAAAMDVHRLSQQKDVQIEQILAVLEKDPLLAARVLKVASSPVYGGGQVQSLQTAVMRVGMRTLGDLVWEVALNMRVFKSKAYQAPMEAVRRHSIAVAHVSRMLAKSTSVPLEYAFLCGLLHDVGAAATLHLLGEGGSNTGRPLSADVLQVVLRQNHAEASQLVARLWTLPMDVQLVLANHHNVSIQGYAHPTAAVIAMAEQLVAQEGGKKQPALPWDETNDKALLVARDALALSERTLDSLRKDTRILLAKLEQSA